MVNILMVASEGYPFAKSGGLGDVIGSLPKALTKEGVDVRVVLPEYRSIPEELKREMTFLTSFDVMMGWRRQYCGVKTCRWDGVQYYFIDNRYYFDRDGLYGHYDEAERFAFYSRAVLEMLTRIDWKPEVLHCHDWQSSLVPVYLRQVYGKRLEYRNLRTILTIHNLKYQGIFDGSILGDILGLGSHLYTPEKLEFYGCVNFLKGGIVFADKVTTVSRSYAEEIKTLHYGENLSGVLHRKGDVAGIVNGVDYDFYNPMKDEAIFLNFKDEPEKKWRNKTPLQEALNLPVRADVPVLAIVSRLVAQKGLDLVARILPELMEEDMQLVVMGTGESKFEDLFRHYAWKHPDKVSANMYFNESIAHQIYAGADMLLMPSEFEPCGLSQMIGMRYGTVPIVRETGGLKDTIQPYNEFTGEGYGFTFTHYNAHDMLFTIRRALTFYRDRDLWRGLVKKVMQVDFSWKRAAREYRDLYWELLQD